MTLCTAWIRKVNNIEELIFATDSCLTGGEKWEGIKLFDLNKDGCLLCFAGSTMRAYPLILNLVSSIKLDEKIQSRDSGLQETAEFICELFTELSFKIVDEVKAPEHDIHELRSEAKFLFGGWDWQNGKFKIWKIFYSRDASGFLYQDLTGDSSKSRFYTFMGDAQIDIESEARSRFYALLEKEDKIDSNVDMEPLEILRDISLDTTIREVGGSLQIAKVYKSNKTEFFGIIWPSSDGEPHFQGREYTKISKPNVKYFDPDTFEFCDIDLPDVLLDEDISLYPLENDFLHYCYPNYRLNPKLYEMEKVKLKTILNKIAYKKFLDSTNIENIDENEVQQ